MMFAGPWLLAAPLLAWGIPGWLWTRLVVPHAGALERAIVALTLGVATVSPSVYLLCVLGQVTATAAVVALVSGFWSLLGVAALAVARRRSYTPSPPPTPPGTEERYLVLIGIALCAVTALSTEMYTTSWWHCPHLSSLYLLQDGSGPAILAWDADWQRYSFNLLEHPTSPGYGVGPVLALQRPGNTAFLVVPLSLMSTGGLTAALFVSDLLIFGSAALLSLRALRSNGWAGTVGSALIAVAALVGARALASYQVNENGLGLGLSGVALHFLLRDHDAPPAGAIAAGVVLGHLVGVRPSTLLFLVPAWIWLRTPQRVLPFTVAYAAGVAVWMTTNALALGDPFSHPALGYGQQPDSLFGIEFTFHPLGFPLGPLARPPMHPFPTLVRLPLEVLQGYGALFCALCAGGWVALRHHRRTLVACFLWSVPLLASLLLIVALDHQKMSYVLLVMGPAPLLAGHTLREILDRPQRWGPGLVATALAFAIVPSTVRDLDLPLDLRQHGDYLVEGRDQWPEERRRAWLTQLRWLPSIARELGSESPDTGYELLTHATIAHSSERVLDGPIIIWAALPPGGLRHQFDAQTHTRPFISQDFLDASVKGAAGRVFGQTTFVVALEAPAPRTVSAVLRREDGAYELSVVPRGAETVDTARYLTIRIVDRTKPQTGQPRLSVLGRRARPHIVTLTRQSGDRWTPEPHLISNVDVAQWLRTDHFRPDALGGLEDYTRLCESDGLVVYDGIGAIVLADDRAVRAVTYQRDGRFHAYGHRYDRIARSEDPCAVKFREYAAATSP